MENNDCRSCRHMVDIDGCTVKCMRMEVVDGFVKDCHYERPIGKCRHYKQREEPR